MNDKIVPLQTLISPSVCVFVFGHLFLQGTRVVFYRFHSVLTRTMESKNY